MKTLLRFQHLFQIPGLLVMPTFLSASPQVINLWPATPPGPAAKTDGTERDLTKPDHKLIAGKRIIKLGHVSTPQMHVYLSEKANDHRRDKSEENQLACNLFPHNRSELECQFFSPRSFLPRRRHFQFPQPRQHTPHPK